MKKSTTLIIFGITGDLATRKLLPAINEILKKEILPEHFKIVGISRKKNVDVGKLLRNIEDQEKIREHLSIFSISSEEDSEYDRLDKYLTEIESNNAEGLQRLFYLAVPPQALLEIVSKLGFSGISKKVETKIMLEKPFGVDLESARGLSKEIGTYFKESQVYRIDHYLAKEMAQNIIVFRNDNSLFKHTWNNNFIEKIEIIASETIGIEGRTKFYEETGAFRDLIVSHLFEFVAITLMDIRDEESNMQKMRLGALKNLHLKSAGNIYEVVKRGQYRKYRDEVGNSESTTETYVNLSLESSDKRWQGVPIRLVTGKCLKEKITQIKIYKKDKTAEPSEIIFDYLKSGGDANEDYKRILHDAINDNHDLFISNDEVVESWRIVAPIQEAWKKSSDDLFIYEEGSDYNL